MTGTFATSDRLLSAGKSGKALDRRVRVGIAEFAERIDWKPPLRANWLANS